MTDEKIEHIQTKIGQFLVFASDFDIVTQLKAIGMHDPDMVRRGIALLRERGGRGCILDVGAHLGTFSVPVALATGHPVHAFEVQWKIAQLLAQNYRLNGIERAEVHHVAIGAPDGPDSLLLPRVDYASPGNFGAYAVDPDIIVDHSAKRLRLLAESARVKQRTIDSFAIDQVDLVKIDVEGMELEVLRGAVETLERSHYPPLLFESWRGEAYRDLRDRTLTFVRGLGYECEIHEDNITARHG